jgi:hypothetical protein
VVKDAFFLTFPLPILDAKSICLSIFSIILLNACDRHRSPTFLCTGEPLIITSSESEVTAGSRNCAAATWYPLASHHCCRLSLIYKC